MPNFGDTLSIYERLRGVNLDELAAKEIAEIFKVTTKDVLVIKKTSRKRLQGLNWKS